MCQRSAVFGLKNYANGGFAEYIKLPKGSRTHVLPKNFTTEQGVLVEPIACGMHALEQAHIDHNDVVVISTPTSWRTGKKHLRLLQTIPTQSRLCWSRNQYFS